MSYELFFHEAALKEWKKLGATIRNQLKKKLDERLEHPRVPADKLSALPDAYKIKLRSAGYRLVYQVRDEKLWVMVIAIGKREDNEVYRTAEKRM